ncbi:hypothetical protein [Nocardioides dilutus]
MAVNRPAHRTGGLLTIILLAAITTAGCSDSAPDIAGVWAPDDGSGLKTIDEDGTCSGMYYNNGEPLDIGGAASCTLGETSTDGAYTLVVRQPPNQASYTVTFDGDDSMLMDVGPQTIRLARQ